MIPAIIKKARELGFIAAGFSLPARPLHFDHFKAWLADGKNADMRWLERNIPLREDPCKLFKGCRAILSLAYPYPSEKPVTPDGFAVSRYAQPDEPDYHDRLRRLCSPLARMIEEAYEGSRTRICVDSAPILEKSFACAAGMGFMGKNNLFIIPGHGSYLYLAEILTDAPLPVTPASPMEGQCGSCRRCLEACPTGALEDPFCLDACRCLSYLTVEHTGALPPETGKKMGNCFFGCDRCQEVCPFNRVEETTRVSLPSAESLLEMDEEAFKERFAGTAFSRAGAEKLKGNIRAVRSR